MLVDSHFDCPEAIYEILLTSFVFLRGIRPFHDGKGPTHIGWSHFRIKLPAFHDLYLKPRLSTLIVLCI